MVRLLFTLLIIAGIATGVALYVPPVNDATQQFLGEQTAKRQIANQQWNEAETTLSPLVDRFPNNPELGLLYAQTLTHHFSTLPPDPVKIAPASVTEPTPEGDTVSDVSAAPTPAETPTPPEAELNSDLSADKPETTATENPIAAAPTALPEEESPAAALKKKINSHYSRLRDTFPQHNAIALSYAQWLAQSADTRNQSISTYRGMLANGDESPEVLNALGNTFLQAAQDEPQPDTRHWLMQWAYYYYETSIQAKPNQFAPRFRLGVIQQQLAGQIPGIRPQVALGLAARHYCNAALIQPNHPETRYNLGLALMNAHAVDEGTTQLNQAIQLLIDADQIPKAQALSQQAQSVKTSLFYANPSEKTTAAQLDELLGQCMADPRLSIHVTANEEEPSPEKTDSGAAHNG